MYKQLFHIVFEFLFKCFFILFFAFILFSIAKNTADARPQIGHKHYRHAPKIHKKNKILNNLVMGGVITRMAFKAVKTNNYNQSE